MYLKAMIEKTRLEKDGTYTEEKLIDEFLSLLDVKINEAKDMLIERFTSIASQSSKAASFGNRLNNHLCHVFIGKTVLRLSEKSKL